MKVICIDARFWGIKHTGIGRYVENLIDNLPTDANIKMVLIVHPDQVHEPKLAGFRKYVARYHPYSVLSQLEMLWLLWRIKPDLLHVPHFTMPVLWWGETVVTIHDLIKHLSYGPQTTTHGPMVYWLKYLGYLTMVWLAVHRANHIIVPAKYWKNFLIEKFRLDPDKISVTYEGVESKFKSKASPQIDLPDHRPYVLYVGNVYPHKNIPTLLAAIKQLQGEVLLMIACARSVFTEKLEKLIKGQGIEQWVKFWGAVSDEVLVSLYRHALAFVFSSEIEGFGLPGLEAMAAGTAVIAANASCLPEVYGNAALYFDPHDPADLASKIRQIMTDDKLRRSLITRGQKQIRKYSWSKMARQTWQIYLQELH